MTHLDPKIKSWVEWQLSHYEEQRRQLNEHRAELMPSSVPAYGLNTGGGSGGESRPTELIALRLTTAPYIHRLEESVSAISRLMERADSTDRTLLTLVYIKGSHNVQGAAAAAHIGQTAAYGRINKLLYALAVDLGLISL